MWDKEREKERGGGGGDRQTDRAQTARGEYVVGSFFFSVFMSWNDDWVSAQQIGSEKCFWSLHFFRKRTHFGVCFVRSEDSCALGANASSPSTAPQLMWTLKRLQTWGKTRLKKSVVIFSLLYCKNNNLIKDHNDCYIYISFFMTNNSDNKRRSCSFARRSLHPRLLLY